VDILKAREKAKKLKKKEEKVVEEVHAPLPEEKEEVMMEVSQKPLIEEKTYIVMEEEKKEEPSFAELAEEELKHAFAEEVLEKKLDYLVFSISGENYALQLEELKEVIKPKSITPIPSAPPHIIGIISLRGIIVPIIDIKKILGISEEKEEISPDSRFVLVEVKGKQFGFCVDSIKDVMRIPKSRLEVPPPTMGDINRDFISYFVHRDNEFIAVLNLEKMVGEEK